MRKDYFDLKGGAQYLRSRGAADATVWTLRRLINSGELPRLRLSRKFLVSKSALDTWLQRAEKRSAA